MSDTLVLAEDMVHNGEFAAVDLKNEHLGETDEKKLFDNNAKTYFNINNFGRTYFKKISEQLARCINLKF